MGSHGSFAGMQARMGNRGKDEDGTLKVVAWVGGIPREDHIVFSIVWIMLTALSIIDSANATFEQRLDAEEVQEWLKAGTVAVTEYDRRYFVPWAQENGLSVDGLVAQLEKTPDILKFYKKK
jgi:hypothetical protein